MAGPQEMSYMFFLTDKAGILRGDCVQGEHTALFVDRVSILTEILKENIWAAVEESNSLKYVNNDRLELCLKQQTLTAQRMSESWRPGVLREAPASRTRPQGDCPPCSRALPQGPSLPRGPRRGPGNASAV